jgi:hypothetical protein
MQNLTIKGATGNRNDVQIMGQGWDVSTVAHIFNVAADSFTISDLTIGRVFYHPIQVHSNPNDADFFYARNVRFIDTKEQLLKVSGGGSAYADRGIIECCYFEFSSAFAFQGYTGGIDAHQAKDWEVRNNVFRNIRSPETALAEHAIHFWRSSTNTLVEGNQIINCDRGIGFGLGNDSLNGHPRGTIRNNFVSATRDVGIGLEYAPDVKVYNNTIVSENYPNAIEYRFAGTTGVHLANNLVYGAIANRDGASGLVESNFTLSDLSIFVNSAEHDYHLSGVVSGIVDAGISLPESNKDYDCEDRPLDQNYDIGADEYQSTSISRDVEVQAFDISIYPNPVEESFTINGALAEYRVEILDHLGQLHASMSQNAGMIGINVNTLPPGLYFVKIENRQNQLLYVKLILKT